MYAQVTSGHVWWLPQLLGEVVLLLLLPLLLVVVIVLWPLQVVVDEQQLQQRQLQHVLPLLRLLRQAVHAG